MRRRPALIPDARGALRFASVRFGLIAAAAAEAWGLLTEEQRAALLEWLGLAPNRIVAAGALVAILFRIITLKPAKPEKDDAA